MVGYQPDDALTVEKKIIAGSVSGALTRFLIQPLDVLKVKTQLQKKAKGARHKSLLEITKSIYTEEGITAFWHGHNLGQVHSVVSATSQFYVYEQSTKFAYTIIDQKYKLLTEFLCGICSGVVVCTITTPLDVIRIRQILIKEQYKGFFHGAKTVYNSGGFLAFYEGWLAGVTMLGPQMGITFAIFSFTQPLILNYTYASKATQTPDQSNYTSHLIFASSIAASLAGTVSKIVIYPLDLARRRQQIASHKFIKKMTIPSTSKNVFKCSRLLQCIVETYQYDGIKGLYRGLGVTLYKTQLTTVLTFTTYELICYFIRDIIKV